MTVVKIIYCIVSQENMTFLKTAFKKEGASHDIMSGGEELINVTMILVFLQIVWMCPRSYY